MPEKPDLLAQKRVAPSPPQRRSLLRIIVVIASVAVVVAVLAAVTWPQLFGLHRTLGVAQLIAFRPVLVISFIVIALVFAGIALTIRRKNQRIVGLIVAGVFLVAAVGQTAVLSVRGWGSALASSADDAPLAQGDITVLSWNAQGGATSAQAIADLTLAIRPDVIALPEADAVAAGEIREILADHGIPMAASTLGGWFPTSVLISEELGSYRLDSSRGSTPGLPSGVWLPDDEDSPPIVVAHPMPPLPTSMAEWRDGLDWVAEQCSTLGDSVIVTGDFNATVDHLGVLPGCSDTAMAASMAASGTWPSTAPQVFASPIDHVLIGSAWKALDVRVIDARGAGSDHRPVVAVLGV